MANLITKPAQDTTLFKILDLVDKEIINMPKFICGGAVRKAHFGIPMGESDIDVFFTSWADYDQAKSILSKYTSISNSHLNGTTFKFSKNEFKRFDQPIVIQLIHKTFYTSMDEVMKHFDFTVCQFGYSNGNVYTTQKSLDDHKAMRLSFVDNSAERVCKSSRMFKYMQYGFEPDAEVIKQYLLDGTDELVPYSINLTEAIY